MKTVISTKSCMNIEYLLSFSYTLDTIGCLHQLLLSKTFHHPCCMECWESKGRCFSCCHREQSVLEGLFLCCHPSCYKPMTKAVFPRNVSLCKVKEDIAVLWGTLWGCIDHDFYIFNIFQALRGPHSSCVPGLSKHRQGVQLLRLLILTGTVR